MRPAATGLRRTPLEPWVLRRAGAADEAGLRRYQLRALRDVVVRARERSRFYAAALAGVEADDLRSLGDIVKLPLTSPEAVRRAGTGMVCVPAGEVHRIVTLPTSGTTGEPKRIHFTAADQELTIDFFHHGMSVLVSPGDRVLVLLPGARPGSVGDLLRRGLARMQVDSVVCGPVGDAAEVLALLEDGGFDAVVGIPVQVLGVARRSVVERRPIRLKSVLLSTDHASAALAAAVESAWDCRVFDHYGSTEMGLGGGVECGAHAGYHLREADLLFEVVDPASGMQVPDGEYGEVVFTSLTREAMPLIRYRTGDVSRFVPHACPCGSWLRLLERVRMRSAGRVGVEGGGWLDLATLDDVLFALPDVVDFRARLLAAGRRDTLDVDILVLGGGQAAPARRATAALIAAPGIAGLVRTGRLRVEVAVTTTPWSHGDGTRKRMLVRSQAGEVQT